MIMPLSQTRSETLPSRLMRRVAVVGLYSSYLAGAVIWNWTEGPAQSHWFWAAPLCLVLCVVCVAQIAQRYWFWGNAGDCALDEREVALRNRAYLTAYTILGVGAIMVALYALIAFEAGLWLPNEYAQAYAILWGVLILVTMLPASVLAWGEPDSAEGETAVIGTSEAMRAHFYRRISQWVLGGIVVGMVIAILVETLL